MSCSKIQTLLVSTTFSWTIASVEDMSWDRWLTFCEDVPPWVAWESSRGSSEKWFEWAWEHFLLSRVEMYLNLPGRCTVDRSALSLTAGRWAPLSWHQSWHPEFMGEPLNFEQTPMGGITGSAGLSISPSVPPESFCNVTLSSSGCLWQAGVARSGNKGSCLTSAANK